MLESYLAVPLWEEFHLSLAQDFIMQTHSRERGVDLCLLSLAASFQDSGRTPSQFRLPQPILCCPEVVSELETYAGRSQELAADTQARYATITEEQKHVFDVVYIAANTYSDSWQPCENSLFLEGQPGRGKMFVVDTICSALRAHRHIVLVVGSSALAATLYEGGRTAHNLFQIPVTEVCHFLHCGFHK